MTLFVVDEEKCKRDGICAAVCPMKIIQLKNEKATPTPTEDADETCINCGHCVAVCPHGAFSLKTMSPEHCPPIRKEWALAPEKVENFLRSRRSIRNYEEKIVDREVIAKLIDIARFAPSGHNIQPVKWLVIYDSKEVSRLSGLVIDWMRHLLKEKHPVSKALHMDNAVTHWEAGTDMILRSAPHIIVTHAPKEERTAPLAGTIALCYLELAAPSFALGTCWAGYFYTAALMWPPLKQSLNLPEGDICLGAMILGYPKYRYHRLPLREEARIAWR
ncbi:MAG: nitroreductase family protein [Pseudomonadota bacterium]